MSLKPLKKALVLKVPRTHSCTEMSCSETTANLESDEIVEPETEAISKEISEAPSLGNNTIINCISCNIKKKKKQKLGKKRRITITNLG